MGWKSVRLGEIAELNNGINFEKTAYAPGIKFISVSNFGTRFSPEYEELSEVKADVVRPSDLLQNNDIVFVRSNGNKELVGRCMLIKDIPEPISYSGFVIRCRILDKSKFDPVFFTYHFKSHSFRQAMAGSAVGANIQNLSQGRMASYEARIPDYTIQKRIAGILSAYDNLIETNQKQINLLEEAAQRLYKEWFVDLRFPGHENTPIIDGVPDGWKKAAVGSIIGTVHRTKQVLTSQYLNEGKIPVIDQSKNMIAGYTNDEETIVNLDVPVIVFGDHTRVLKYITFPFAKGADGTQLIVSSSECMPQPLLYCSLTNVDLSNYHYARHFKYLKAEEILVPSLDVAKRFSDFASPLFNQIKCLHEKSIRAATARDRLLPKLMSGGIEV